MRDYEYLPAGQRKLAEQLDEEDFKREERTRELEATRGEILEAYGYIETIKRNFCNLSSKEIKIKVDEIDDLLCNIEENILEVLNKYN